MPQGTLANLATSAFVRTPPLLAERIVCCLLAFPVGKATNMLDPTAGEGDLLLPCCPIPQAWLYGVEISAERTAVARERLPQAELVTCAFEGVSIPKASMSLVLANPPYFFQDGKRAEYRILADAGTLLVPGGVLVAIIPARSAWDGTMINHWCRWYDRVRVWKFPDRTSPEDEGAFEEFTQICVVGIWRAEPRDPIPAEARRLQGYRYHTPSVAAAGKSPSRSRAGWEQGTPPPELPITPISDPYPVPESLTRPHIVVRHADESLLLAALERTGAHLTPTWQAATEWREEGLREQPVMPLSGEAHVAAEVLTGLLDGEIVWGPVMPHAQANHSQQEWAMPRHLASHYGRLVRSLDDLARRRNTAARLAKGTVPRWFAVLPCDQPFQVWETRRDRWGDTQGRALLVETERLEFEYLYPLERRLVTLVQKELGEQRRVMVYFEQNDLRSMARRLEWILKEVHPWTLANSVAAEDRQQAILQAVQRGHRVVIVPYRRVNEGLNLQSGIDTILWVEMALNLFMLDQASRRAWRLGKGEEVRIYYLAYANTAGHTKLRKLGQQSGAAAAFAGEPARGALIAHAGADKTTLARLSSLLEQSEGESSDDEEEAQIVIPGEGEVAEEEAALKVVFARRAEELRTALARGREWLGGIQDDLAERHAALAACPTVGGSVWSERPQPQVRSRPRVHTTVQGEALQSGDDTKREVVETLPVLPSRLLPAAALTPALPDEAAPAAFPAAPVAEPAPALQVGSRAEVVFGRDEHIALARVRSRPRRSGGYGEPLKRRTPVSERDIPSLTEGEAEAAGQSQQVAMPSLWDLLVTPTSGARTTTPSLFAASQNRQTPHQSHLWE